jgi:hypothetical protein
VVPFTPFANVPSNEKNGEASLSSMLGKRGSEGGVRVSNKLFDSGSLFTNFAANVLTNMSQEDKIVFNSTVSTDSIQINVPLTSYSLRRILGPSVIGRNKIREPSVSNTLLSSTRSTVSDIDANELINTSQKGGAVKRHILSDKDANELINTSQKGELLVDDLIGVTHKVISLPYNLSSMVHGFLTVDVEQKISVEYSQKLASWGSR